MARMVEEMGGEGVDGEGGRKIKEEVWVVKSTTMSLPFISVGLGCYKLIYLVYNDYKNKIIKDLNLIIVEFI